MLNNRKFSGVVLKLPELIEKIKIYECVLISSSHADTEKKMYGDDYERACLDGYGLKVGDVIHQWSPIWNDFVKLEAVDNHFPFKNVGDEFYCYFNKQILIVIQPPCHENNHKTTIKSKLTLEQVKQFTDEEWEQYDQRCEELKKQQELL